ncbi:hypothetical protein BBK36DRAFT_1096546, partial [Trichoderma citrinoviride]
RRADQTRTTCGECHARRLECYPYGPTCVHCLLWGLDCVMPSEEERTLSPESEVILKIEDGLSENEAQGASAGSSTGPNSIYVTGNHAMSAQRHALRHRYLAGGRHNCRSLQIDSAKVLSWPVFAGQLDPQAKAMAVLPQKPLEQHRPPGRHQPSSCLILLVWALGAITTKFPHSRGARGIRGLDLGAALFGMAYERLGAVFAEGGILPAQCFFYAGVYLLSILQPVPAWRHFLQALAYCQEFDVVVQAATRTQAPTTTPEASPAEVNLYWSCWKAEVDLRLSLGLYDFQTQGRVYIESLPEIPVNPLMNIKVRLFFLAEISLLRLATSARNDIERILWLSSRGNDEDHERLLIETVETYKAKAQIWLVSLPQAVSFSTEDSEFNIFTFTLCWRLVDFGELIFWPFLEDAINSGEESLPQHVYHYAGHGISTCVNHIRMALIAQKYRHEGTWMLLQSCARSVIVLMAASLSHHAQSLLPENWISLVDSGIHVLRHWIGHNAVILNQI